jgi:hypothetical protein
MQGSGEITNANVQTPKKTDHEEIFNFGAMRAAPFGILWNLPVGVWDLPTPSWRGS